MHDMLNFTKPAKLYLFKDRAQVNLSILVSDTCVNGYNFTVTEFEELLDGWDKPTGVELKTAAAHFIVAHKHFTPRPECANTSYVRFSVFSHGMTFHHRLSYDDMQSLRTEYFYQKNNRMHWDT